MSRLHGWRAIGLKRLARHLLRVAAGAGFLLGVAACGSEEIIATPSASGSGSGGSGGNGMAASSQTGATDAASSSGTGIGEPSDMYPAPHDPAPTVVNSGGPVLTHPYIVPIFFEGDDAAMKASLLDFTSSVGATAYWEAVTKEYGVGAATAAPPIELAEVPAAVLDLDDVKFWLAQKLNSDDPLFPPPDESTLYAIFYPVGVTLTLDGKTSCESIGAYHGSIQLNVAHGGVKVPYAALPRCDNDFLKLGTLDFATAAASHEFIEAATDPFPGVLPAYRYTDAAHILWSDWTGGEVSDLCAAFYDAFTKVPGFDYMIQRSWSNEAALAGHDPCVPSPAGEVYFNAVPKLADDIETKDWGPTKGVKIAEGETKTIDVDLFSDGPTEPFAVDAYDVSQIIGYQGGSLELIFDENLGQNGQTLHLTITVQKASSSKLELFQVASTLKGRKTFWLGVIGN